jgi:hypothetical protein
MLKAGLFKAGEFMRLLKAGLAALPLIISATSALAADAYVGRWAADAGECEESPLITLAEDNVSGATFGCESATYAKDGGDWAVSARQCSGEDETEAPYDLLFRLRIAAGKLQVFWDDGTKSALLIKCKE